ncbi:HNH endonuclease [Dyadobacter sp. CY327]|uniref:HNH endonuclease n=1 Tax=Dyadobacter sp. CY327 TaxID=2907301 RepID=UPI0038D43E0B
MRTKAEILKIRNSRQWRDRIRPQQLEDFPLCAKCHEKGILREAVEVDHKEPLETAGDPFDPLNLQSLCKRCHVIKSAHEARVRHIKRFAGKI